MRARRFLGPALAVAMALAIAIPSEAAPAGAAQAKRTPSRMLVTASEWSFVLSRTKLPRGPAIIELYNRGEDPHNLRIRSAGGGRLKRVRKLDSGDAGRTKLRLAGGRRYRLWCSLPNHRERGMKATLKVTRKR